MTTYYTPPRWHVELTMAEDAIHAKLEVRGKLSDQAELDEVVRALLASRPLLASGIAARSDETTQLAQPEGQEPGGEAETPNTAPDESPMIGKEG